MGIDPKSNLKRQPHLLKICGKVICILMSKGYEPIRHIGNGNYKVVFLVTKKGGEEFAAKLSYLGPSLKKHEKEIEMQEKFGDLAVQATEVFTVNEIALVEIQDKVEVYRDVFNAAQKKT